MPAQKDEDGAGRDAPRQTYMPKPPSKEEVNQVSREQGMIADDWTGEPSASTAEKPAEECQAPENEPPPPGKAGGG
jgi:hypothetical protein